MKSLISFGVAVLLALSAATFAHAQYLPDGSPLFGSIEFWQQFVDDSGNGSWLCGNTLLPGCTAADNSKNGRLVGFVLP